MNLFYPLGLGHIESIVKSVVIPWKIMGLRIKFLNLSPHPTIKKDDMVPDGFGKC
jgi:hypothetical protein